MRDAAAHRVVLHRGTARVAGLLLQAGLLAYGVGLVVHLLHGGQHELHPISPVLHWLRDSSLALPLAVVAVLLGASIRRRAPGARGVLAGALASGAMFALLAIPGNLVHARLFLAEHAAGHHGAEHLVTDAAAMLGPSVLLALAGAGWATYVAPGRPARAQRRPRGAAVVGDPVRRRRVASVTALTLLATLVPAGLTPASAATNAPTPSSAVAERCTATSAVRTYDVRAIQVEIPYNRWGQTDPNGLMYALAQDVDAIKNWHLPLNADPALDPAENRRLRPRPLVIRANEGECVQVTLKNELPAAVLERTVTDPRVSLHVHGASFDVATSDGSRVGHNADTTVGRGESITYLWRAPKQEGVYEFHDHGLPAGSQADGGSLVHGLYGALAVEPAGSTWLDPRSGLNLYPPSNVAKQSGDLYLEADIVKDGAKAFRESVQLSQDEVPGIGFSFNYASEPASNREANLCPDCVGEETSLSSWTYGDPGMVKLASGGLPDEVTGALVGWKPTPALGDEEDCQSDTGDGRPRMSMPVVNGTRVPASCWTAAVVQAYQNDPMKIRFGHVGPKETHVFHLHAHQWLAEHRDVGKSGPTPGNPSDINRPESTTVDSQTYGPGDMFTADLLFGAGSKPGTAGDSIFHCHLYPHFADGFWALLRVHDVLEDGLGTMPDGTRVRTLLPLPDRTAPAAPTAENPGFPRFIPGTVGWRAPQPPSGAILGPDGQPAPRVVAGQLLDPAAMASTQTITRPAPTATTSEPTTSTTTTDTTTTDTTTTDTTTTDTTTTDTTTTAATVDPRFTLSYQGETTGPISPDAPASGLGSVEEALEALTAIVDVTVSDVDGAWRVVFADPARNVTALTSAPFAEGGTAPTITVETGNLAERLALERKVILRANGGNEPKPGAPLNDPCPSTARVVTYDAAVIQTDVVYNEAGWHDTQGRIIVPLADVDAILAGTKKPEPLFIRVNAGDCINYNLTNMLPNWFGNDAFVKLAQTNMVAGHIHLVKFDVLGSDGSSNGWNYQQAAYSKAQHDYLAAIAANKASCTAQSCRLPLPADYDPSWTGKIPGQTIRARWYADYELRTVFTHDHHFPALDQNRGLYGALVVEPAGMDIRHPVTGEYFQPINDPAHGPVCGTACTGTASGPIMDVVGPGATDDFREFGVSIQDFVSLTKPGGDPQNPADTFNPPDEPELFPDEDPGVMAINYRNAPLVLRNTVNGQWSDPAYQFSSRVHGDPWTPLLQAYAGDPVRMRVVQGSQEEQHVLAVHGVRWRDEPDDPQSPLVASKAMGISDAFNFEIPEMDCGIDEDCRGDYLYSGAATDDTWLGAWGIMRVFGKGVKQLLPLPDRHVQATNGDVNLSKTGTPPPKANKPGTPCPTTAPVRSFQVVAADARIQYNAAGDHDPYGLVYTAVRPGETVDDAAARVRLNGTKPEKRLEDSPEPMSLRANEGDCIEVTLVNKIDPAGAFATVHGPKGAADGDPKLPLEAPTGTPAGLRVSLHPQLLKYDVRGSDGATIGFNRDQTVAPGESILYRWWADDVTPGELGAINLLDFGDVRGHRHHGLFAGLTIVPAKGRYHDPLTGEEVVDAAAADVRIPGAKDFRSFTTFFQDGLNLRDKSGAIIHDPVDHPAEPGEPPAELDAEDSGEKGFNYRSEPFHHRLGKRVVEATQTNPMNGGELANVFSSAVHGDPATPTLRAYTGDPVRVSVLQGADKPRQNVYKLSGHSWMAQPDDPGSSLVGVSGGISVARALNVHIPAAGGAGQHHGDYRYSSNVGFHHLSGGLWGINRVYRAPVNDGAFVTSPLGTGKLDNPYTDGYHPIQPLERAQLVARVYNDSNMDQQQGKDERAVPAEHKVTVTVTPRDTAGKARTKEVVNGVAVFDVVPGSYDVSTSVPADWGATTPTTKPVESIGENGLGETSFGLVQLGDVTVQLFQDQYPDALRGPVDPTVPGSPLEPALSGWSVTLNGTGGGTATTDAEGRVRWDGLRPGSYTASVAAPTGWLGTRTLPVKIEVAENGSTTTDIGFNLKAGLSVHVFNDADKNGQQLAGTESSLAGWEVTASGGPVDHPVTVKATTDMNGNATFDDPDPLIDGLRPGAYTLTRRPPQPQWAQVGGSRSVDAGAPTSLDCPAAACSTVLVEKTTQVVTLAEHNPYSWVVAAPFNDVNNDGVRSDKESKLVGPLWKATFINAAGTVVARDVPVGSNGEIAVYPLEAGTYTLQMTSPERSSDPEVLDWTSTGSGCVKLAGVDGEPADSIRMRCTRTVSVIPGERGVVPFGFIQLGTIGVTVFQDFDRDGVEGTQARRLAGRTAYLYDEGGKKLLQTRTTDSAGMAAFKVSAGVKYQVQAVLPTGWAQTTPLAANGSPVLKVKITAPTSVSQSVEQVFGQYNTNDTTPPPVPTATDTTAADGHTKIVSLSSEANATFRYTLDGSIPTASVGMVYSGPITISSSRTLNAIAIDAAGNESTSHLSTAYTIKRTTTPVTPDKWVVTTGGTPRGTVASQSENLMYDDGVKRWFLPAALSGKTYVVDGYATTVLATAQRSPASLGIEYDGGASLSGSSRTLSLYDFAGRKWEQLQAAQVQSSADMRVSWDAAGDPKRFVSSTGEVRVRVHATRSATFELRADQLNLVIGQAQ